MIPKKPNNCLRVAHTADWHLRDRHLDTSVRGPDFTAVALQMVEDAKERDCDIIVNAGDVLNVSRPSSQNIKDLQRINKRLLELELPMLLITGNHDMTKPTWISHFGRGSVGRFGIIPADHWTEVVESKDGQRVRFTCLPWMPREELADTLDAFTPSADTVEILVWHEAIREFCGFPSEARPTVKELQPEKFKAILLGDIHQRNYMETEEGCLIGYPGATELCAKDEPLAHSYEILDIPFDGGPITHYPAPLKTRPVVTFHATSESQVQPLIDKIKEQESEGPMVFVRYNPNIEKFVDRVRSAVSSDCILRLEPIGAVVLDLTSPTAGMEDVRLEDLVPRFFTQMTSLCTLATRLCNPQAQPSILISEYTAEVMSR